MFLQMNFLDTGMEETSMYLLYTRPRFNPWVGKIPWRRKWQPCPVFLPGESHGRRSLVGYSPWGSTDLDTIERRHYHFTAAAAAKSLQSCPTLCDPVDCNLLGSSVHGILQARMLEWIAISFSRGSSQPRDWTQVSRIVSRCFYRLSHQGSP